MGANLHSVNQGKNMRSELPFAKPSGINLQEIEFKESLQQLGNAIVSIVKLLSLPPEQVSASALGSRLALLLTCVRKHRSHVLVITPQVEDLSELMEYLQGLGKLRATVAQWLTIHAAQPRLIHVNIADFEKQSWTTLALGMVLLDGVRSDDLSINGALPSSFHQWWGDTGNRATGLMS